MALSSKAAPTASELPVAADDWILVAQRNALFDGIMRGDSLSLLTKFADNLLGFRGLGTTPSEQAELVLYAKIKNRADHAQLQKLVEKVCELEKKQKDDNNMNNKTNSDGSRDDDGDQPANKKARTARKTIISLENSENDLPAASTSKRRSIFRPEDEPVRAKLTEQPRPHQKPRVDSIDDEDDIGYDSNDSDPRVTARKTKAKADEVDLRRKVLTYGRKLDGNPRRCSNRKSGTARQENTMPQSDSRSSNEDDYSACEPFQNRSVSINSQKTAGQSIVRPADHPRTGRRGALGAPAEGVPKAAIHRASAIQRDPNESNALAYRRAEVTAQAHENQHLDDRGRAPDSPTRAPAGRPSQDYDAPDDAAYVLHDAVVASPKYKYRNGRKYRVIKALPRFRHEDGAWALGDVEVDMECLSDNDQRDMDLDKPSETKIKLNGWNGMPWDKKWDPVPDPEPRGSAAFAVAAGEALLRRSLGVLELSRHEGMVDRKGSEYIHAEGRRSLVPGSRERDGRARRSYRASPSVVEGGSVAGGSMVRGGGSNMGPPPSTINTVSARYSVREGRMVERTDSKHERGVTRTTSVASMGVDRDIGVQRSLLARLGLTEVGTPIEESIEQEEPGVRRQNSPIYRTMHVNGISRNQPLIEPLTVSNVAQLEKETGHPRTIKELVDKKLRPDEANPRADTDAGSVYAATVIENDFGDVLQQTFRTREEITARQHAAYAAEGGEVKADTEVHSGGSAVENEQTWAVRHELTREELDAEERGRDRRTQAELETLESLFAPSNASSAFSAPDDYLDRAGSVSGSSTSQRPAQGAQGGYASRRGNSNFNNSYNGGGSNWASLRGGDRGSQRSGYRGGRGGCGEGSQSCRSNYSIPAWFKG